VVIHSLSLPSIFQERGFQDETNHKNTVVLERLDDQGRPVVHQVERGALQGIELCVEIVDTHILEAIGARPDCPDEFLFTATEPYGVLCLQGLKVSMIMHTFGKKRWSAGLQDDIRSITDQNTRLVGDFAKMVKVVPIYEHMRNIFTSTESWVGHFERLLARCDCSGTVFTETILPLIEKELQWLAIGGKGFRRQTLQTRFFETGDNFYLGMEFNRFVLLTLLLFALVFMTEWTYPCLIFEQRIHGLEV